MNVGNRRTPGALRSYCAPLRRRSLSDSGSAPAVDMRRPRALYRAGEAERLQSLDAPQPGIGLIPVKAERRRIGKRMVVVVPELAPAGHRQPGEIAAAIGDRRERSRSEQMTERIDPRHRL